MASDYYDIIVIGGGAAGLMAAARASELGLRVLLLEKTEQSGRKIRITGKGRCNLTNTAEWKDFSTHLHPKPLFFRPAFYAFSNKDTMLFFEKAGLPLSVERGNRVFPASGKSKDVVDTLIRKIRESGGNILCGSPVKELEHDENGMIRSVCCDNGKKNYARTVILATGGLSYPATGSTGDGYRFAAECGHRITPCFPSLTALLPNGYDNSVEGLELKNIGLRLMVNGACVQEESGDIVFTNNGLEGSLGFRISRRAVKNYIDGQKVAVEIDMKPAVTESQLFNRISRYFQENRNVSVEMLLQLLLPSKLIPFFATRNNLNLKKILSPQLSGELHLITERLKAWKMDISGYTSYERAVITAGGIATEDIVAKTMASKKVPNLFFAGEIIDIDADTGGYNLQIAFSTGYLAAQSAAHFIRKSNTQS